MSTENVTPIRSGLEAWDIWPGIERIDHTGARLARDMLVELETYDPALPVVSVANRCMLEDWCRDGGPFRNVVAEYMARAQAAGPEALSGFCAVLSDYIANVCQCGTPDASKYDRWCEDAQAGES